MTARQARAKLPHDAAKNTLAASSTAKVNHTGTMPSSGTSSGTVSNAVPDIVDVAIVGAGPVGLLLALRLLQCGLQVTLLEKQTQVSQHSRAIGVHPPTLERLAEIGLADKLIARGVRVQQGVAASDGRVLGALDLSRTAKPFNFVLSVPQFETEALLLSALQQLDAGIVQRGSEAVAVEQHANYVRLHYHQAGSSHTLQARYVVACDGKHSRIRQAAGIAFVGAAYPDSYLMADVADDSALGDAAYIDLARDGLVESFPLPGAVRRWVVKTPQFQQQARLEPLRQWVAERSGYQLAAQSSMLSSFGVQRFVAKRLLQGRIILAGDAAHVLSPIGGQGMNLGMMDAWQLASSLEQAFAQPSRAAAVLEDYQHRRRRAAFQAIRRAEFNMVMGRRCPVPRARVALVKLLLRPTWQPLLTAMFTMRGLP